MPKNEKVYSILDRKNVIAIRQSNQTFLVKTGKLIDSDRAMIEDKRGYRYQRRIDLEQASGDGKVQVFSMI